ncbi:MAG: exodeoxyribonuclease VII large subunit [Oscillospiraceae bacterium]|nr:exodeoxyribonuclease VII large subunit [Oscillospiraceae bacterium]
MEQRIYDVSQINEYLRLRFDEDPFLNNLFIRGEISNYKLYPSGHHYFSLKDSGGAIRCVMFKGNAFRLRFRPENGMKVIASGRISVFPRDGAYQLYCTGLTPEGVGDLHLAFEQLKTRLSKEGLFLAERKKSLPKYPHRIALITSSAGAAVRDMLRILRKRYPLCKVMILPVRVQGEQAAAEIAGAIRYANRHRLADLIITGRGGGSIEDLWAFNEEPVAYAISESEIPVISAVGHEPDVTISDFVADLRAATPSNAAELAVPDQIELRQQLLGKYSLLQTLITKRLKQERQRVLALSQSRCLKSPLNYIQDRRLQLDHILSRLSAASIRTVGSHKQRFIRATAKLDAMSPLKVLSRGFAVASKENQIIRSVSQLEPGDHILLRFADGQAYSEIREVHHG